MPIHNLLIRLYKFTEEIDSYAENAVKLQENNIIIKIVNNSSPFFAFALYN